MCALEVAAFALVSDLGKDLEAKVSFIQVRTFNRSRLAKPPS
jgi:hypothetical protein